MKLKLLLKLTFVTVLITLFAGTAYSQCTFSGLNQSYCTNSPGSTLSTTTTGGTFSGPGVIGTTFSPSVAGPGTHTIVYSVCQSSYAVSTTSFAPSPSVGVSVTSGDFPNSDDGETIPIAIPFPFQFFCNTYTTFIISTNGFIEFGATGNGCCSGQFIPNANTPNNLIAFCWTDLNPGQGGTITYTTLGTTPTRTMVVSFSGVPFFSGGGSCSAQVKLCEGTNIIEIHNVNITGNTTYIRTQGLENINGTAAATVTLRNATTFTAMGDAVRFTPGASCSASQTTIVSPSTITVVGNNSICAGATTTLTATGNTTYSWNTNSNASSITVSPNVTTTYAVAGTNSFGCVANSAITVTVDNTPTVTIVSTNTTGGICPSKTVALSGSGATTYTWTGGISNGVPFTVGSTSSFTVTGTNACGSATAATSISIHPLPTVGTVVSQPTICSGNPVVLTGVGNATAYAWSGGVINGANFFPSTTGTYTVIGTSAQGCTNSAVASVTVVTTPVAQPLASPPLICIGNTSTLSATGASSYTWFTPSGTLSTSQITVAPNTTTTYTITKSNANCVNTQTLNLIVNQLPSVFTLATPSLVCASKPSTLQAAGAQTYTWYAPGPPSFTVSGSTAIVYPASNTIYTVVASDGTCVNTSTVQLFTNPNPTIIISPTSTMICRGDTVTLSAQGANGYVWTLPTGTTTGSSITDSPVNSFLYLLTGTNNFGCSTSVNQIVVVNPTPTLQVSTNKPLVCSGAPANLTVTGANSYSWDANTGGATTNVVQVNPTTTTIYTATGYYSQTNCSSTKTIQVAVFLPVFATNNPTSSCLGGTVNLTASGALSYTWNGSQPFASIPVSPSQPTVYIVAATSSSNGVNCISSQNVSVTIYANPTITAVAQRTLICKGEATNLIASGGSTYQWSTSQGGGTVSVNPQVQTVYNVTGTDQNGCVGSTTVMVKVSSCFGIEEFNSSNVGLVIYPNPNNGVFVVKSNTDLNLNVVNELGQVVRNITLNSLNNHQENLSGVANGIYFLVGKKENYIIREKIVVGK